MATRPVTRGGMRTSPPARWRPPTRREPSPDGSGAHAEEKPPLYKGSQPPYPARRLVARSAAPGIRLFAGAPSLATRPVTRGGMRASPLRAGVPRPVGSHPLMAPAPIILGFASRLGRIRTRLSHPTSLRGPPAARGNPSPPFSFLFFTLPQPTRPCLLSFHKSPCKNRPPNWESGQSLILSIFHPQQRSSQLVQPVVIQPHNQLSLSAFLLKGGTLLQARY